MGCREVQGQVWHLAAIRRVRRAGDSVGGGPRMGTLARHRLRQGHGEGVQMKKPRLPPFVPLLLGTMDAPAWRMLSPSARCLYITLKRRDTGRNNGDIFIGQRKAAKEMNLSRPTVAKG